jgi:hypothetical protein
MSQSSGRKSTSDSFSKEGYSKSPYASYKYKNPSGPADDSQKALAPDLLKLRFKTHTFDLFFEPYAISDGMVHVSDVRKAASEALNVDPRRWRLRLTHKGNLLSNDTLPVNAYNIKQYSEVLCDMIEKVAEDVAESDALDIERDRRKNVFDAWSSTKGVASTEPHKVSDIPNPYIDRTASRRKPAGFDPSKPGGDEPMAPRTSAYAQYTQIQRPGFAGNDRQQSPPAAKRGPITKPGRVGSTVPVTSQLKKSRSSAGPGDTSYTSSAGAFEADHHPFPQPHYRSASQENIETRFSAADWDGKFNDGTDFFRPAESREGKKARGAHDQNDGNQNSQSIAQASPPSKFSVEEWADMFKERTWSSGHPLSKGGNAQANDTSNLPTMNGAEVRQTARGQLGVPEQPARPRSAPVTDFHSIAAKAFQEDVFVWSSVTRDLTPTMASVDTQSDRNLVYLGFLENDLRLEYKKYNDGGATPLKSLGGSVWPLGWVMLKIFPFKTNHKSGIKERHRPQHVVFDVYEMTTFGDMLLGNEYAEGNDICNFLIKGSRKTTARTL